MEWIVAFFLIFLGIAVSEFMHTIKKGKKYHADAWDGPDDTSISLRDVPPADYRLKIDSFSGLLQMLSKAGAKSYKSQIFEAGELKWSLSLYPNGDEQRKGKGHISMYVNIEETDALPLGWGVHANFKLFVLDQISGKFLTIQDASGRVRSFHAMKTEWGFARLLPHSAFYNASNGYILHDKCVFGAEIFVIGSFNYPVNGECLSRLEDLDFSYTWKISQFSTLIDVSHTSEIFSLRKFNWKLRLYPRGDSRAGGRSLSLFLLLADSKPSTGVYAEFKLSILDQLNSKHKERKGMGCSEFLPMSDIKDTSNGFLVDDTLVAKVQITRISPVRSFS